MCCIHTRPMINNLFGQGGGRWRRTWAKYEEACSFFGPFHAPIRTVVGGRKQKKNKRFHAA